jgi:RimJ/RimL family protein N-acetyltransferase
MDLPTPQPALTTERLVLRPFAAADAPEVHRLAGDRRVADTTISIPHPYEPGTAEAWIAARADAYARAEGVTYAITDREAGVLIGAVGLHLHSRFRRAEMGYWIGVPHWNRGYATEAARAMVRFGFETIGLNRIYATHFPRNQASGRVMEKTGMRREGVWRQHLMRWDRFEDAVVYGILREEWRP